MASCTHTTAGGPSGHDSCNGGRSFRLGLQLSAIRYAVGRGTECVFARYMLGVDEHSQPSELFGHGLAIVIRNGIDAARWPFAALPSQPGPGTILGQRVREDYTGGLPSPHLPPGTSPGTTRPSPAVPSRIG